MESLLFGESSGSSDYVIDPITNKKVPRRSVQGPGAYGSLFSPFVSPSLQDQQAPIFYDGAPPEAELEKYDQVQIDAEPWDPASRNAPGKTVIQSAPRWSYRGVSWHRNDGITSSSGSASAFWQEQFADELGKYKPVMQKDSAAEARSASDPEPPTDLGQYKAVRADEPDGKYKPRAARASTPAYDDLDKYGAVRSHEPDGKYKPQAVQDPVQEYDDLHKYKAVRAHEPDGRYKALAVEDPTEEYKDLGAYGAVRAHEPDGKYKVRAVKDSAGDYTDLDKYRAVRAHEPDGKYKVHAVQDPAQEYDDLHTSHGLPRARARRKVQGRGCGSEAGGVDAPRAGPLPRSPPVRDVPGARR